jgi:hypothetical protein
MQPRAMPTATADPGPRCGRIWLRITGAPGDIGSAAVLFRELLLLLAQACQMRVAQIELPLDPAPRFVLELAAAIQIIDEVTLCGN